VISTKSGVAALLRDLIAGILRERDSISPQQAALLPQLFAGMIACTFRNFEVSREERSARADHRQRIVRIIDQELHNPKLCPRLIAERLDISESTLYTIARNGELRIGPHIVERRLDRCREQLDDPRLAHRSITEIAFAWGFKDLSHFSRRFSARFDKSPRDYRREARQFPKNN
jgi:AraC-like DNA-binding protein